MDLLNKIYEAINNGITKALILSNDPEQDVSIKFHHKKVSSTVDMYNYLINDLYENPDHNYAYDMLKKYCKEHNCVYIPADIHELNNFFKIYKHIPDFVDTSKSLLILDENAKGRTVSECLKKYSYKDKIMLLSPELINGNNDNSIILSHCKITAETSWCKTLTYDYNSTDYLWPYNDKEKAIYDYDGWMNTYGCQYITKTDNKLYRLNKDKKPHFGDYFAFRHTGTHSTKLYDCYVPALGQLIIINECVELINYILKEVIDTYYRLPMNNDKTLAGGWWSSTDPEYDKAWLLRNGTVKKAAK